MKRKYEFALTTLFFFTIIALMQMNPTLTSLAATFEKIRSATSMSMVLQMGQNGEFHHTQTFYWKSPNRIRIKKGSKSDIWNQDWWLDGQKVVLADHQEQTATILNNPNPDHPIVSKMFDKILTFSTPEGILKLFSEDCKKTGTTQEDGNELDMYTGTASELMAPRDSKSLLTAYINQKSQFPERIDIKFDIHEEHGTYGNVRFTFHWNDKLSASLFEPDIPEGYKIREIDGNQKAEPLAIKPGEGVGAVKFHMSQEQVVDLWGQPDQIIKRVEINNQNYVELQYYDRGIALDILPGIGVGSIKCCLGSLYQHAIFLDFTGETPEGIRIGMTEEDVVKKMGEPVKREEMELSSTFMVRMFYPNNLYLRLLTGYIGEENDVPRVVMIGIMSEDCPLTKG